MKKFFIVIVSIFTLGLFGCLTSEDSTVEETKSSSSDAILSSSSEETKNSSGEEIKSSSSEETKNSSGEEIKSSSSEEVKQCKEIQVYNDTLNIFSWIEENGEGKRDTIIDSTSFTLDYLVCAGFVGNERVYSPLYKHDSSLAVDGCGFMAPIRMKSFDSVVVCPGDSLYNLDDTYVTPIIIPTIIYKDTVYLNYTENAIYDEESIVPTVEIINKEAILASLDTLYYGISGQHGVPVMSHFQNDNADWDIEIITDTESPIFNRDMSLGYGCEIFEFDPCNKKEIQCPQLTYRYTKILITDSIPKIEGDELQWRLIASNRFGFADTLEVTSKLVTAVCPAQAE